MCLVCHLWVVSRRQRLPQLWDNHIVIFGMEPQCDFVHTTLIAVFVARLVSASPLGFAFESEGSLKVCQSRWNPFGHLV